MTGLYGFARRLRVAAYLLATYVAVSSISDVVASSWPMTFHEARWRIGVTTLIAGVTPLDLVAVFLCIAIAFLAGNRRVLWFIGALCAAATVVYLALSAELALDLLQLRQKVRPDLVGNYDVTMALGELRLLIAAVVSSTFSLAAFRVRRYAGRVVVEAAPAHASRFFMGNVASPGARVGTIDEV